VRIKLIMPIGRSNLMGKDFYFRLPALGLLKVAALTPAPHTVTISDEALAPLDFDKPADLVGLSVMTPMAMRAYEIADEYRRRGVQVVLGGVHATMCYDEAIRHADTIVKGQAEGCWEELLRDAAGGALQPCYASRKAIPIEGIAPAPWRLVRGKGYLPVHFIETSRGCSLACEFCSVTAYFGGQHRFRPVGEVVREIEGFQWHTGRFVLPRAVFFVDDNIINQRAYALDLFKQIERFNMNWTGQVSMDLAEDDELLNAMVKSNCIGVVLGIETIVPENAAEIGAKIRTPEYYRWAGNKIHDAGIGVYGAFVFGFDQDGLDVFERFETFIRTTRLDAVHCSILTPYPGTRLHRRLKKEGRLFHENWEIYDTSHVVFQPARMTPDQLLQGYNWALSRAYSIGALLRRYRHERKRHFKFFGPMNIGFRITTRRYLKRQTTPPRNPIRNR